MSSEIVVKRAEEGSEIFIAYRDGSDDLEGCGISAQDAYVDLLAQESEVINEYGFL